MKPAKQEDGSPELLDNGNDAPAGGGGLVGIITSLSGVSMIDMGYCGKRKIKNLKDQQTNSVSFKQGEGGSDIGALIGALTGVIAQIFGVSKMETKCANKFKNTFILQPGGLDIETLISSATSLISGLLAGDKNFGTVLGIYVGTALDGLSGGGGAVSCLVFLCIKKILFL